MDLIVFISGQKETPGGFLVSAALPIQLRSQFGLLQGSPAAVVRATWPKTRAVALENCQPPTHQPWKLTAKPSFPTSELKKHPLRGTSVTGKRAPLGDLDNHRVPAPCYFGVFKVVKGPHIVSLGGGAS